MHRRFCPKFQEIYRFPEIYLVTRPVHTHPVIFQILRKRMKFTFKDEI